MTNYWIFFYSYYPYSMTFLAIHTLKDKLNLRIEFKDNFNLLKDRVGLY
jgi:hypothetical protein